MFLLLSDETTHRIKVSAHKQCWQCHNPNAAMDISDLEMENFVKVANKFHETATITELHSI